MNSFIKSLLLLSGIFCLASVTIGCGEIEHEEAYLDEDISVSMDELGMYPHCTSPGRLIIWTEPVGVCGRCRLGGSSGQVHAEYAACSNNISGTTTLIDAYASCEFCGPPGPH